MPRTLDCAILSKEKEQVKEALLSVNYLDLAPGDWEGAALLSRELRGKGIILSLNDLLVAHLAKKNNLVVLSLKISHFQPTYISLPAKGPGHSTWAFSSSSRPLQRV